MNVARRPVRFPLARLAPRACLALVLAVLPGFSSATPERVKPLGMSAEAIDVHRPIFGRKQDQTARERKLDSRLLLASRALAQRRAFGVDAIPIPANVQRFIDGYVDLVDETLFVVITTNNVGGLAGALSSLGGRDIREFPQFGTVTAFLPLANVIEIAGRVDVLAVAPRELMRTNKDSHESQIRKDIAVNLASPQKAGTVTWEGVAAHKANSAHSAGLTGVGAKVCVLSDGTDSVPARISSGDLPVSVSALSGQTGSGDEGTAMLEIVHDMAPGASLFFATALPSVAQFATNIINLYTVFGCHVIVDDITYFNEGAFQDGPIAQAVNSVTASGAIFLSSAGNSGNLSDGTSGTFEGDFVASLVALPPAIAAVEGGSTYPMHMFGALPYTTLTAESEAITLKWSDPLGGAINDYDLFVMDSTGTAILEASISAQTGTQSPFEIAVCSGCAFPVGSRIYVVRYSGSTRAIRLDTNRGRISNGTTGSAVGHNAAASAITVAAVDLATAGGGAFVGGGSNPVETFSSDGPRRVFYLPNGTAITPGNVLFNAGGGTILNKVDLAAGDGGSTTTPGFISFFGTSAAAPTAAAIAALVKAAKPTATRQDVTNALLSSALDIEAPGLDRDSGVGIVMAPGALRAVLSPLTVSKSFVPALISPGNSSVLTISVTNPNATLIDGVVFTDTYPASIVNAPVPNATISGTGCSASGLFSPGSNNLTVTASTIPAGTTCIFKVTVTGNVIGPYTDASGALSNPISLNTPAASATLTVATIPGAPTGVSASAGIASISVTFSAPVSNGGSPITGYTAACTPVGGGAIKTMVGAFPPIVVGGLVNGVAYTCTVTATNVVGTSPASTASNSVTPSKGNQTISFGSIANKQFSSTPFGVSATASSGLAVTVSSLTLSVCTVSGMAVTTVTVGICTLVANQAGDGNYNAAPQVTRTFTVGKGNQVIIFGAAPANVTVGGTGNVTAAGGASGNPVIFNSTTSSVCSITGATAKGLAAGTCIIAANQAGNANYNAAPQVTQSFPVAVGNPSRLGNISTRMQVLTGNDVMIGGFVIGGSTNKTVAIVATGPSLIPFGITNALANPTLRLVRSSDQTTLASNDNWQSDANQAALSAAGFAPTEPLEAALLVKLAPGAYTAIVEGAAGGTGVAVVGVYEVDGSQVPLVNISTRGRVLTGNDVMIGGFVIQGTGSQTLAIVATGPSLIPFGIANALANPTIRLVRSADQTTLATNDDWQTDVNASQLQAAGFAPLDPVESGIYTALPPGAYTVVVEGVGGGTGVAVIGVYKVN